MKIPNKIFKIDKRGISHDTWMRARNQFLGSSEVGTILGLNQYESPLEIFHRKVGVIDTYKPEQLSTYAGHVMEPVIYENFWRYYDPENPTPERMIDNALNKRVMRTARRVNFTLVSAEFPWMSCSLDYAMDPSKTTLPGPLDCKNSLNWVVKQYEGEVHPGYICQIQHMQVITGWAYGELGFLLDGRYLSVIPVPANAEIQEAIIREGKKFWQTVVEGRKIWLRTDLPEHDRLAALVEFEPEITASSALEDYLKKRYVAVYKQGKMVGTKDILEVAIRYLRCNENLNQVEEDKTLEGNILRKLFMDHSIDEVIFQNAKNEEKSMITYRMIGEKATLRVSKDLLKLI